MLRKYKIKLMFGNILSTCLFLHRHDLMDMSFMCPLNYLVWNILSLRITHLTMSALHF